MKRKRDWREAALRKAAEKYGRAFKCGPTTLAREVLHKGAIIVRQETNIVEMRKAK